MGFAARAIFQDNTKRKTLLSSKWLKKICIERTVISAVPENTQKATQFGMSVFKSWYTDFFYAMFENSKQEHTVSSGPV